MKSLGLYANYWTVARVSLILLYLLNFADYFYCDLWYYSFLKTNNCPHVANRLQITFIYYTYSYAYKTPPASLQIATKQQVARNERIAPGLMIFQHHGDCCCSYSIICKNNRPTWNMCVCLCLQRFVDCGNATLSAKQERNGQAKPPDTGQLKVKVIRAVEQNSKIFRN